MPVAELHDRLSSLSAERATAALCGLDAHPDYMADLDAELAEQRVAFVGLAVTEIATLRAEFDGPLLG